MVDTFNIEYFFIPLALTIGSVLLFWLGLGRIHKFSRTLIFGGVTLLVACCLWQGHLSARGGLSGVAVFIVNIGLFFIAIVAAAISVTILDGRRKLLTILIGLIFPIGLFSANLAALGFTPEANDERYAVLIGQRLDRYKSDYGYYPDTLESLLPRYIDDLREPKSVWGWLYTASVHDFTLGYVYWVGWGYSVCIFPSATREWDCLPDSSGPFHIPPTPVMDSIE